MLQQVGQWNHYDSGLSAVSGVSAYQTVVGCPNMR